MRIENCLLDLATWRSLVTLTRAVMEMKAVWSGSRKNGKRRIGIQTTLLRNKGEESRRGEWGQ